MGRHKAPVKRGRPEVKLGVKRGRPKGTGGKYVINKNVKTLPQDWEEVILSMYAEGAGDVEVMKQIWEWTGSFSYKLWERWIKEEDRFKEVIDMGGILSKAWWERNGRKNIDNKGFNSVLWYMNMKNRFGWADTQSIEHKGSIEHIGVVRLPHKKGLDLPVDTIPSESTMVGELVEPSVNSSEQNVREGQFTEK